MPGRILNDPNYKSKALWQVEIKIHEDLQSINWEINNKIANEIEKIFNKLPTHKKGFPNLNKTGPFNCSIHHESNAFICTLNDWVIGFKSNVFEVKMDGMYIIKNEILRTCPAELYRNVCNLLSNFKTKRKNIKPNYWKNCEELKPMKL